VVVASSAASDQQLAIREEGVPRAENVTSQILLYQLDRAMFRGSEFGLPGLAKQLRIVARAAEGQHFSGVQQGCVHRQVLATILEQR
jgi:hypothetical protein